jgi:predicted HTH domain antitoxin
MSSNVQNVSVRLEIPWQVASGTPPDVARRSQELRVLWIVDQVRRHSLGIGKGAELAALPRAAFMQLLGEHGVPSIDYPIEDFEDEIRSLGGR